MGNAIDRFFGVYTAGSSVGREVLAGTTTFMTMAYIVFVNPAILSAAFVGQDLPEDEKTAMFRALVCATCVAAAFATFLMGLVANYPIALAPGMGLNAFLTYTICLQMDVPWPVALGMVFVSGVIFLVLSLVRVREMIINAVPEGLKLSAAVGIGVFIAFIGLQHAGLIVAHGQTFVGIGDLTSRPALVSIAGFAITVVLYAWRVRGAILLGIAATGLIAFASGLVNLQQQWVSWPVFTPLLGQLDVAAAISLKYLSAILVLLFFDMFDTVGTLIGVSEQAGFLKDGRLPRANRALFCDAAGTTVGAVFGTSTVTSYIESAAGVADGGRTGLANMITGAFFILAMFFAPVAEMFGGGLATPMTMIVEGQPIAYTNILYPVTAPALVVVGCLMMASVRKIDWADWTEAVPAFLTVVLMPLTFSISTGLFAGLVAYPLLKLVTGRGRQVHPLLYVLVIVFLAAMVLYLGRGW